MKKEIGIILVALFLMVQVVSAVPIENIITVQEFPSTVIAGSTYKTQYQFDNTQPINLTIFFNITNDQYPVNFNETFVGIKLNDNFLNCPEISSGIFMCNEQNITEIGTNIVNITLSSRINLQPSSEYNFTLSLLTKYDEPEQIPIVTPTPTPELRGGGGDGNLRRDTDRDGICDWFEEIKGTDPNNPCDPNPECKACLALKQKQSALNETSIVEAKITIPSPTPFQTPETPISVVKKPFQWKFMAIPLGIIIAIILFLVWRGREYEDEDEEYFYEK